MDWLASNWLWVLLGVLFIGMHFFGHAKHCCGEKGERSEPASDREPDNINKPQS